MIRSAETFKTEFIRHAQHADLIKISDEDADSLYGTPAAPAAKHMIATGTRCVLATYGPKGAELFTAQGSCKVPITTLPGPIIDTMGAGDATLATITAQILAEGFTDDLEVWNRWLRTAMDNAAATCRAAGARLQTPDSVVKS